MPETTRAELDPVLFARLFEAAPDLLCIADLQGRFHRVNGSWSRVLGWDIAEIEGGTYRDFVHPDDLAATEAAAEQLDSGGTLLRFVNRYRVKGGGWRDLEWSSVVVVEEGLIYAVVRDVTEQRRDTLTAAQIEQAAGVGSWSIDIATGTLHWSPMTFALMGQPADGQPTIDEALAQFAPEGRHRLDPALHALQTEGTPFDMEVPLIRADGTRRWVRVTGAAEMRNGQTVRAFGSVQDMTDTRRMERRLDDALRATGAGTWEWNAKTGEHIVNAGWLAVLGYDADDMPFCDIETWRKITHPDDLPVAQKAMAEHLAGRSDAIRLETRMRHRDGRWICALDSGRITSWTATGEPEWVSGTIIDVSALRAQREALDRATEALKAREAMMAGVFAQSPVGLALVDHATGRLLDANPALLGPLGYDHGDVPSLSLDDLIPPESRVQHALQKAQLVREGSLGPVDTALFRRDGSRLPVTTRATLLLDATGWQMALWVVEDVTERRRLEGALRRERDFMGAIVDTSTAAILVIDHTGMVEFANGAAEALAGHHGEAVRWRLPDDEAWRVLKGDGTPLARSTDPFQSVIDTGKAVQDVRLILEGLTGGRRVLSINAASLRTDDEAPRVIAGITDITGAAEYAEALERTVRERTVALEGALEKQQQINHFQRRFVSVVSHEFRTPLAIIDGSARRVERVLARGEPERAGEYVENVRGGVQRLTGLLETMLETARLQEGSIDLSPEPMQLAEIVADAVAAQADLHPGMTLAVERLDLAPIVADPRCVRQIVDNMLSNAIKYSGTATHIEIVPTETATSQTITVHDHGIGVSQADLANIFRPFFRAATAEGLAGSGLGLSLSRTLARLNGGDMTFESEEGRGSRVTLTLPRTAPTLGKVS